MPNIVIDVKHFFRMWLHYIYNPLVTKNGKMDPIARYFQWLPWPRAERYQYLRLQVWPS